MTEDHAPIPATAKDNWALGIAAFAGCVMVMIAIFQVVTGIAALVNGETYLMTEHRLLLADPATWGWVHLVLGVLVGLAAFGIFAGVGPARAAGILLAAIGALANFLDLPVRPLWSAALIALYVTVIWALSVYTRPYRADG
ncbi:DUF7144 family membrane protein [Nonomuraea gerenzanensis]|uniref:DUF7144 domain-containing protein n=1 Tax=Nonomuraea gerenzanensis TaxID=93944 RepID=A0A1M4EGQ5_9ACTN|nr:hypothetical protein [Nonomuraea gerenzanensis]UBU09527.1 hypothetical protein LCN96_34830 [Nonomuraea gerenzanensis]SBO97944.1 hypothetical protein BN4615_P7460 [Nonomuraea gerenzanensis]